MTVSIGIVVIHVTDTSADAPLSRNDISLYRVKENGHNHIEITID